MRSLYIILAFALFFGASTSFAKRFPLPENPQQRLLGKLHYMYTEPGDSLLDIANRSEIPLGAIKNANENLPKQPKPYSLVKLPPIVLPDAPREGIVINRAENRLYFYPEDKKEVWVFPVAMGRFGWETPLGTTKIIEKRKDPRWYVPESIQIAMEEKGVYLPDVIGSGPMNPLGTFALKTALSRGTIMIHGTNKPSSIGKKVSSGCIRMFNKDVEQVFKAAKLGMSVRILEEYTDHYAEKNTLLSPVQRQTEDVSLQRDAVRRGHL